MTEAKPQIAVLLSYYNGDKYIAEQIESIIKQNDVKVNLFIRDDGSIEESRKLLERVCQKYSDDIEIIDGENIGFSKSFYTLLNYADGYDYYAFADQDDVWLPEKLTSAVNRIDKNSSSPEMCFCNAQLVDERLQPIRPMRENLKYPQYTVQRVLENLAPGCMMVFNKTAREFFLKANMNAIGYHDHWMYIVCSFFGTVIYDECPRVLYRLHSNNVIGLQHNLKNKWISRLKQVIQKTHFRENYANQLNEHYASMLNDSDIIYISQIANYRKSLRVRMKLLSSKKLKLPMSKQNFWLKVHILIGNL